MLADVLHRVTEINQKQTEVAVQSICERQSDLVKNLAGELLPRLVGVEDKISQADACFLNLEQEVLKTTMPSPATCATGMRYEKNIDNL